MVKSHDTEPTPGTKTADVIDLLMRDIGATTSEILDITNLNKPSNVGGTLTRLSDDFGYDIRTFWIPGRGGRGDRRNRVIYKIVGRKKWDCSYESYIDPKKYDVETVMNARTCNVL